MRFLSLFSGVGGFDLGLELAGMECVGQVEIDPFCRKVLERHWPQVWRAEDVRSVGGDKLWRRHAASGRTSGIAHESDGQRDDSNAESRIDLICGGFPCQDLSVAGKRAGLDGARSGLWFEFHRIVSELRPTYVLVENVPGLLSSNQGRDFAVIIDGLGKLGYGVSWAVLDSQHFGVAQRRRRVFIVAGPPDGRTEAVLAIAEGCAGHPPAGRTPGQDVAAGAGDGVAGTLKGNLRGSGWDNSAESADRLVVAHALRARPNASHRDDSDTYVPELSPAVTARDYKSQREDIAEPASVVRTAQTGANGIGVQDDQAYTLDGTDGQAVAYAIPERGVEGEGTSGPQWGKGWQEELAYTMEARNKTQAVAWHENMGGNLAPDENARALRHGASHSYQFAQTSASVRRLTPVECCRLQGFPDDWFEGNDKSDGPMYRALGNAVTVPVIQWIGERMMVVEAP